MAFGHLAQAPDWPSMSEEKKRRSMLGQTLDWPLSREEKKRRLLHLYECELQVMQHQRRAILTKAMANSGLGCNCSLASDQHQHGRRETLPTSLELEVASCCSRQRNASPRAASSATVRGEDCQAPLCETSFEDSTPGASPRLLREIMDVFMTSPPASPRRSRSVASHNGSPTQTLHVIAEVSSPSSPSERRGTSPSKRRATVSTPEASAAQELNISPRKRLRLSSTVITPCPSIEERSFHHADELPAAQLDRCPEKPLRVSGDVKPPRRRAFSEALAAVGSFAQAARRSVKDFALRISDVQEASRAEQVQSLQFPQQSCWQTEQSHQQHLPHQEVSTSGEKPQDVFSTPRSDWVETVLEVDEFCMRTPSCCSLTADETPCHSHSSDELWMRTLQAVEPQQFDQPGRTMLNELKRLVSRPLMHPTCTLSHYGASPRPILVTAPHSIPLLRDDNPPHKRELKTADIATALAQHLGAACLQWSDTDRELADKLWQMTEKLWSASPHVDDEGCLLRPCVRDPNFLTTAELPKNPWHQRLRALVLDWSDAQATLHLDVHGSQDPPASPAHLTIGLGAMLEHAAESSAAARQAEAFAEALQAELPHVLASVIPKRKGGDVLRVVFSKERSKDHVRFSGAWPADMGRHTLSQQAISFAGFTHAIQLELSRVLRDALFQNPDAAKRLSNALRQAWAKAKQARQAEDIVG